VTSELKACKTCGLPAEVKPPGSQRTRCSDASGECPDSRHFVTFDEWNRRAPSPAVARLVEACQALREQDDLWMAEPGDKGPCVEWHRRMVDMQVALAAVEKEMQH
jgi:hypothetical protein